MEVKCIRCGNNVKIDISKAIYKNGDVLLCPNCGFHFRYTEK